MRAHALLALLAAATPAHAARILHVGAEPYAVGDEGQLTGRIHVDIEGVVNAVPMHIEMALEESCRWRVAAVDDAMPTELEVTWLDHQTGMAAGVPLTFQLGPLYGKTLTFTRGEEGNLRTPGGLPPTFCSAALSFATLFFEFPTPSKPANLLAGPQAKGVLPWLTDGVEGGPVTVVGLKRHGDRKLLELTLTMPIGPSGEQLPTSMWIDPDDGHVRAMHASGTVSFPASEHESLTGTMTVDVSLTGG